MWFKKRGWRNLEIAPEEIFLDASNPMLDHSRFEGRLETPLERQSFLYLGITLTLLFLVLVARGWYLEVAQGNTYATQSEHNGLATTPLFAPRGVIMDTNGVVVAENTQTDDGSLRRSYPYPSLSQVLGYVSYPKKDTSGNYYDTDQKGVTGLEAQFNSRLTGQNGKLLIETDALGHVRSQGSVVPAVEGQSLKISLDADLQEKFNTAIADIVTSKHFLAGSGVVMDVHSGAVRAIVSYPTYDSNVMTNGGPSELISAYNRDPAHPFLDHAVQGVYTPGSIVKPLVSIGALTDHVITGDTVINDPGSISVADPYHPGKNFVYNGWKALGPVDVKKAIAWSSDVFFYTVGGGFKSQPGLGIGRLDYWYQAFGLGTTTNIGLPGESAGVIPSPAWKTVTFNEQWYLGDTYFTAIGQYGMQVTPIQMARAVTAIANGGKLFNPTVIADQIAPFTRVPIDSAQLPLVHAGMRMSVTSALAQALNVPYVSVAAKTGTAQTGVKNQYDNSWVIGFFPYDNPQYAFSVVLERGPSGTGEQAVNVMRNLLDSLYVEHSPYVGGSGSTTASR